MKSITIRLLWKVHFALPSIVSVDDPGGNESGIRESLETAIIQVSRSENVVSKIATAIVTFVETLGQVSKFELEAVRSEVAASAKELVVMAPLSPRLSGSESSLE